MRKEMAFRHRWILGVGADATIPAAARLTAVMAVIAHGKPDEGEALWPAHDTIGDLVGVSARTARRHMQAVADANWLHVESGRSTGVPNRYTPVIPEEVGQPGSGGRTALTEVGQSVQGVGQDCPRGRSGLSYQVGQDCPTNIPIEHSQEHSQEHTHEEQTQSEQSHSAQIELKTVDIEQMRRVIAETKTRDDLKMLRVRNWEVFDANPDLHNDWKAKGKSLPH